MISAFSFLNFSFLDSGLPPGPALSSPILSASRMPLVVVTLINILHFYILLAFSPIPRALASLINIAGFFIVPTVLRRVPGKQLSWLKLAMGLVLMVSFAIYHASASATPTDRAVTLYRQALACRLLLVLLGIYALVRPRTVQRASSS